MGARHTFQRHLPVRNPAPLRIICASFHSNLSSRLTPLFQYVGIRSRRVPHDAPEKDDHGDIDFYSHRPRTGSGHE